MRNCRQTTGNPESKYLGAFCFLQIEKRFKTQRGAIVTDHQENMRFSCIYKWIPFINEPNTPISVRSPLFYRDIYEKSRFSLDTIEPNSLRFLVFFSFFNEDASSFRV